MRWCTCSFRGEALLDKFLEPTGAPGRHCQLCAICTFDGAAWPPPKARRRSPRLNALDALAALRPGASCKAESSSAPRPTPAGIDQKELYEYLKRDTARRFLLATTGACAART